jgi:beta-aspartyl-peptidase (threonine type)
MRHRGEALEVAAAAVVEDLGKLGGSGGLIAVDAAGRVSLPFNSQDMYRGIIGTDGVARTGIYRDPLREG